MVVDTRNVKGRRELHFANYQELLDEVHALAAGPTRQLGNWSLGQICWHLARAMDTAVDGPAFKASWVLRLIGPWFKKRITSHGVSPGFKLPKGAQSLVPGDSDTAAGVTALERAIQRLEQNSERTPHAVFGPMTREEWDLLQLRHAEMHLSFIVPD